MTILTPLRLSLFITIVLCPLFFPLNALAADFVVNFASLAGPIKYYGSGYEFAFGAQYPLDQMVKPLKPQTFRTFNFWMTKPAYDRVIAMGATPNVALTDGQCNYSPWPGDGGGY